MIKIRDIKYWMTELLQYIEEITDSCFAVDENHLIKKLNDKAGTVLAVVLPSAQNNAPDEDNQLDINTLMLFVVRKDQTENQDEEEIVLYEETQDIIETIKNDLTERRINGIGIWSRVNLDSINVDPENRIFGGWSGWSMSFEG